MRTSQGTPELDLSDTFPLKRARYTGKVGFPIKFALVAEDTDDCVELSIRSTGLFLGSDFDAPENFSQAMDPHERKGTEGRVVRRLFQWPVEELTTTEPCITVSPRVPANCDPR